MRTPEIARKLQMLNVMNLICKDYISSGMLRHGLPHNLHNLAKWHLKRIVLISRHETWQTI